MLLSCPFLFLIHFLKSQLSPFLHCPFYDIILNSNRNLSASLVDEINHLILEGLFTTITNVNFDDASIKDLTARIHTTAAKTANACNSSIVSDYDMNNIWNANEDIRSLKSLILFGVAVWQLCLPCNGAWLHRSTH